MRKHTRYPTFGDFVDAHQGEVHRYLRRLTGNLSDAEDLFQETFLRALPAFRRLRAGSNHRAWVYRIATNVFLNHRRTVRRRNEVPLDAESDGFESSSASATVVMSACRRVVASLPRRQRAAFVQRNLLGFSYADIAATMGGTETAARANVYQAACRLRRELIDRE